jgi:DNA-binding NarL/FixJ family response regulator
LSRILCIEDDPQTAELLTEALKERGYEVDLASDGDAGLATMLANPPDIVVCDVRMPGLSGFELRERLSAAGPSLAHIPFVFLTALGDRDSELLGRRLGADDYLTKPIDFEMLDTVIQNLLRRRLDGSRPQSDYHLTDREREVLAWVGRGKTSSEIAIILGLRERTVNFHCDRAMKRLDVTNRTQAVAKAIANGLISV